ncbi:MAG: response regulator, partial [Acidobacteriota bacterium]
ALLARKDSLAEAAERVRTLRGLLPMCPVCKMVRDDDGFWSQVEEFVSSRTKVQFSHGLCPDCGASALAELDPPGEPG